MVPSQKIANLLKYISTPAIAQKVYGYGTQPEKCKSAGQVNQHSSYCIERYTDMVPSQKIVNLLSKQISTQLLHQDSAGNSPAQYSSAFLVQPGQP